MSLSRTLARFPTVRLVDGPTPLQEMPRLARRLGVPRLLVKRDDCTGLAFGGNKTRKLAFTMGDALAQGADVIITTGAWQSNHVRQTAAAAAKLGLRCNAVVHSPFAQSHASYKQSGNALLDRQLGARIHEVADGEAASEQKVSEIAAEERAAGATPYIVPLGASNGIGSLGYVECAQEILQQCSAGGFQPSHIVLATGSAGTHAGLLAGLRMLGSRMSVIGISVSEPAQVKRAKVQRVLDEIQAVLAGELPVIEHSEIVIRDEFVGTGYGIPSEAGNRAMRMVAREEGIILDPVYTAKAMAGFIGLLEADALRGAVDPIFLHTGGGPALFAYELDPAGGGCS